MIRNLLRQSSALRVIGLRHASQATSAKSGQPLLYVEERKEKGYAVLKMNKPPVNSLCLEFLTELNIHLDKLEENKDINGVILTSNLSTVFSAGLDILELYKCKPERCAQFWATLQDFFIKLYGSNKVYIAAVNGQAPAGGCMIAICCDYRIMVNEPKFRIGLNESLLGIKAPFWLTDVMTKTVGNRVSEKALQLGLLFSPEEALKINLVDEICSPQELMPRAEAQIERWLKIPTVARELTKSSMRRDTLSKLIAQRESDVEFVVEHVGKELIQSFLRTYLEGLKNKQQRKKQ